MATLPPDAVQRARLLAISALSRLRATAGALTPDDDQGVWRIDDAQPSPVDAYWSGHTVNSEPFHSAVASRAYLDWRFREYPLFREFSGLWGRHDGEAILDYGCGPGNDVTGFALHTKASRIVGADVSSSALSLARHRLDVHRVPAVRAELVRLSDRSASMPFDDAAFDFIQSQGVLHHVSDPAAILAELHRVLRPGGRGVVMVYNRDSLWFHLYVAYQRLILDAAFPGKDADGAFVHCTDGEECPISRCYAGGAFADPMREAGFEVTYVGGYLSRREMQLLRKLWTRAIADDRLAAEHRDFLRSLTFDAGGYPMHRGYHAGIGGTYRLRKAES